MTSKAKPQTKKQQSSTTSPIPSSFRGFKTHPRPPHKQPGSHLNQTQTQTQTQIQTQTQNHRQENILSASIISPEVDSLSMTKKKVIKDRWVCDICRTEAFDDYDDACKHEETCKGDPKKDDTLALDQSASAVVSASASAASAETETYSQPLMSVSVDDDENDIGNELDFEETPMLPKKLQFLASANDISKDSSTSSARSGENASVCTSARTGTGTGTNAMVHNTLVIPKPLDATCLFEHCEICETHEKKGAKNGSSKRTKRSKRGASAGSPEVQVLATNAKKAKKTLSSAPMPTAPLFLNQKTAPSKKQVPTKETHAAKKGNTKPSDNSKTPRTTAFAAIFQKTGKHNAVATASDSLADITEQEQKAMLAEHRAAEFASKRRAKQQEEKERQAKREEMRRLQYEAKQKKKEDDKMNMLKQHSQKEGKVASIFQSPPQPDACSNISSKRRRIATARGSEESPVDLTFSPSPIPVRVPLEQTRQKVSKKVDWKKYPPRFPNPSHMYQTNAGGEAPSGVSISGNGEEYESLVSSIRYQQSKDSISQSDLSSYQFERNETDDTSAFQSNEADFLYRSFSSVLNPCVSSLDDDDSQYENPVASQLWSDKYTMQSLPHDVYGQTNKEVAEDLINFVNDWKGHRLQICEARAEKAAKLQGRKKKKTKKKAKRYESDHDDFFSDDEEEGLKNVYLLTGVTGSGKTSLVRAAAKHCNCILIEINTTMERGGRALKKEIEECTQSLSNLALRKSASGGILQEDGDDETSEPSLAVILIDEVDILFESEGDQGFWQSLSNVAKKARCPIILTASSAPSQLVDSSSIKHLHSGLVRPTPYECVSKICQIARMEGMSWQPGVNRDKLKDSMAQIAKYCGCDIRRIMNEMQLYGLGHSRSVKSDILLPLSLSSCTPENVINIAYPQIKSISPDVVQSHTYSVITVRGKNFSPNASVEIIIGNQRCPATKTMNSSTILAVVPPCQIPEHVNAFGYLQTNLNESMCTRYASVRMCTKQRNGCTLRSDSAASMASSNNNEDFTTKLLLEYSFPDPDDMEDLIVHNEIDPKALLENAVRDFKDAMGTEQSIAHPPVVSCTPMSQNRNSQDQMTELSKHFEIMSDCCLQRDVNAHLSLPPIAGAMCGFEVTNDMSSVELGGWGGPDSCKGSFDTFVTVPTSRRDRLLISKQCNLAEGFSSFNADPVLASFDDDEDKDIIFSGPRSPDEESYVPIQNCNRSTMLPNDIFEVKKYDNVYSRAADVGILEREQRGYWDTATQIAEPFFDETRFVRNFTPEYFRLEYLPHLRNMAYRESIYDKNYAALKLDEDSDDFQRKRRRTRRSTRKTEERIHYFDHILDTSCGDNEGKAIGEELATTLLRYSSDHSLQTL